MLAFPMLLSLNTCGNTASVALGVAGAQEVKILATASLAGAHLFGAPDSRDRRHA